jgi:5-hydroxyisourate hydrolase
MNRISTHVLDLARGKPAIGVPIELQQQDASGNWRILNAARTDQEGRCQQLMLGPDLPSGVYRLRFDTSSYFATQRIDCLYPVVEVTFQVREGESHFHLPLLLTANGYTTYRGT